MAVPSTPQNFIVQTANQQVLVSWNQSAGATSYSIQRSLDNVTFTALTTISGSPLATSYIDTAVTLGTQYWYKVAAVNGSGTGNYTTPAFAIPTAQGEYSLAKIRELTLQKADRLNTQFVTTSELNSYINLAMYELYDLLVTVFEDYFMAAPIQFVSNGATFLYPLPDGQASFLNPLNGQTGPAQAFYKLLGCDLALNTAANGYVTINKFSFVDRNRFVYPNTASTIYGVFNLQYRIMGNNIMFIPTPSANQQIRLWYIPRLNELLADTDTTAMSISGWIQYVIIRAAKYILDKEESDTAKLDQEILYLKTRIEETAANRDAGMPDKISDTRQGDWSNGWRGGNSGNIGGF